MSDVRLRAAVWLVREWTRLYTAGLPAECRDRRRAEIQSDLWETCRDPKHGTRAVRLVLRLVLGVGDDLAWRSSQGHSRTVRTALIGTLAASLIAAALLVLARTSGVTLPEPAPIVVRARPLPPPPPPPPPPCVPPGAGEPSPSPCTR